MSSTGVTILMFQCVEGRTIRTAVVLFTPRPVFAPTLVKGTCWEELRNICFPKKQSGNGSSLRIQVSATSKFSSPLVGDMSTNIGNRENSNGVHNSTLPYRR
ncbi:unnamed protein product [Malus baccata var. baccata]